MKPQYSHKLMTSFALWMDNYLLTKGEAYKNISGHSLTYNADPQLPDKIIFSSAYKQWVYDSSVPGATVKNYISGAGYPTLSRQGQPDLKIDYDNGRIMFNDDNPVITYTSSISADFAVKDFNIYPTDVDEESLIIDSNYQENARYSSLTDSTGIAPYTPVTPAIFVSLADGRNEPFALGGMDESINEFRCVVFAENPYQLDGALSIFRDSKNEAISFLEFDDHPHTAYGDLKTGNNTYNQSDAYDNPTFYYTGLAAARADKVFVKDVYTSRMSNKLKEAINPELHIGFVDFIISDHRNPRN